MADTSHGSKTVLKSKNPLRMIGYNGVACLVENCGLGWVLAMGIWIGKGVGKNEYRFLASNTFVSKPSVV